jgi:hypothetical protein
MHMIRISDARISSTALGTVVLHQGCDVSFLCAGGADGG